jgi:MoaA/NifB/PqqE/SkfB family radical SAM enzyme
MQDAISGVEHLGLRLLAGAARTLGRIPPLRAALVRTAEARLIGRPAAPGEPRHPPAVEADKRAMGRALLAVLDRVLAEDRASAACLRGLVDRLLCDVLVRRGDGGAKSRFVARHGCSPPDFLTLSPGKACNLRCLGCYANAGPAREALDWATLERVVSEARTRWGTRFFVISGGEPFAYHDAGHGLLDLAALFPDCFFLSYTNGTLIDDRVARRLAELGNLTPAFSVEGMRERTDARRGRGVFDRVLAAMERLRREKVLYGLSLTATRENVDEILCDETVEFFFGRMGALYAFVFHYMPIGRGPSLDLMLTPEQRRRLLERVWSLVRERRLLIADFWNSATATNGCLAAGRPGGYLYIDWNGNVSPCVFMPYSTLNIREVYARGGSLDEVWSDPFFAGIRAWQRAYGYRETGEAYSGGGNWLRPCPIRDHHRMFRRLVAEHGARANDAAAREALTDTDYLEGIDAFDRELAGLTDPIWRQRYAGEGWPPDPGD